MKLKTAKFINTPIATIFLSAGIVLVSGDITLSAELSRHSSTIETPFKDIVYHFQRSLKSNFLPPQAPEKSVSAEMHGASSREFSEVSLGQCRAPITVSYLLWNDENTETETWAILDEGQTSHHADSEMSFAFETYFRAIANSEIAWTF